MESVTKVELVAALHEVADEIAEQMPEMDRLADAVGTFLRESRLTDEFGTPFKYDSVSVGYGVMLGLLVARRAR